jgi:hypothetical protein
MHFAGYPTATIAAGRHILAPPSAGLGDGYITIGHGILDPPQLFMQNKSADCSAAELSIWCLESRVRVYVYSMRQVCDVSVRYCLCIRLVTWPLLNTFAASYLNTQG